MIELDAGRKKSQLSYDFPVKLGGQILELLTDL
jgi:hypothetical protein